MSERASGAHRPSASAPRSVAAPSSRTALAALTSLAILAACVAPSDPAPDGGHDRLDAQRADGAPALDDGGRARDGGGDPDAAAGPITYHQDLRPIVERACVPCHRETGGLAFSLDGEASVLAVGARVAEVVRERRMPPSAPDPACRPVQDGRVLDARERSLFERWEADGFLAGDPDRSRHHVPPARPALGTPTRVLPIAVPYAPDASRIDDFQDFDLAYVVPRDTWLRATAIVPGAPPLVHHANAFARRDAPEGGGAHGAVIAGWSPGMDVLAWEDGEALLLPAGASLWMSVHYHARGASLEDRSALALWERSEGTPPAREVVLASVGHWDLDIAAGDPRSVQRTIVAAPDTAALAGVAPHMHLRGVSIRLERLRPDGTRECLVDVPGYRFDAQRVDLLAPGARVELARGEPLELTCVYDNSAANQPVVDGRPLPPEHLEDGDSSLDEMCVVALLLSRAR